MALNICTANINTTSNISKLSEWIFRYIHFISMRQPTISCSNWICVQISIERKKNSVLEYIRSARTHLVCIWIRTKEEIKTRTWARKTKWEIRKRIHICACVCAKMFMFICRCAAWSCSLHIFAIYTHTVCHTHTYTCRICAGISFLMCQIV